MNADSTSISQADYEGESQKAQIIDNEGNMDTMSMPGSFASNASTYDMTEDEAASNGLLTGLRIVGIPGSDINLGTAVEGIAEALGDLFGRKKRSAQPRFHEQ